MAFFVGDALKEIGAIKVDALGVLDYSTLPSFTKKIKTVKNAKNVESHIEVRDLGATVSMLTVAIQQLAGKIKELEKVK